jgi:hypothetical protein
MFRQKTVELCRLVSSARWDRAQPVLCAHGQYVQQAFHGGGPSSGSHSDAGPQTDAFTEKLQEKGRKELESLTTRAQDDEDDWVDVWPHSLHCPDTYALPVHNLAAHACTAANVSMFF